MDFRRKLLLTYTASIFVIILLVGSLFFAINLQFLNTSLNQTYAELASGMVRQLDNLYEQMDVFILDLLSDEDIKSVIETLAVIDHEGPQYTAYFNEAASILNGSLLTYSVIKNFHSIVLTNTRGDYFSSDFAFGGAGQLDGPLKSYYPWLSEITPSRNNAFLIPPDDDPFSPQNTTVFGYGRYIHGPRDVDSYFMALKPIEILSTIVEVANEDAVRVVLLDMNDRDLFYSNANLVTGEIDHFAGLSGESTRFQENPVTGEREKYFVARSDKTNLKLVIAVNRSIVLQSLRKSTLTVALGTALLLVSSFFFNVLTSRYLTKPLRKITGLMKETQLNQSPAYLDMSIHHDEILDLRDAFYELVERLNAATRREIQLATSWMQARFDALQEQINPHFVFNSLTVISRRAFELGDEEIQTTCESLVSMLRYSTSTVERDATIAQEVEHVRNYLILMEKRLGKRLTYSIDVADTIANQKTPKIILQQLVENSISHGYRTIQKTMQITISGRQRSHRWEIEVADNGEGFDPSILLDLNETLGRMEQEVEDGRIQEGFEIGGMGLTNTWLRLYLFYNRQLDWEIESSPGRGSVIRISAPMEESGES